MPDMSNLLAQAQQMQEQLVAAKDELARTQVTGSAANGMVTATVSGTGDLVRLDISPELVDPSDVDTLADTVVAAVRDATDNANQVAAEQLGPLAGADQDFGLPGGQGGQQGPIGF